jgi:putative phosphoesterase
MKVAIISDIHANLEALNSFPESYDQLWVLGDLVNYGPNPSEAVEWVRERAAIIVRGNHDNAIGFGEDCRCSARFREMAEATCKLTESLLSSEQKTFLRDLPDCVCRQIDNTIFFLCHATPSHPLFEYRAADSPKWELEEAAVGANVVIAGHTHRPFVRTVADKVVANPGSLGQSRAGDSRARYAIWHDGRIELKSYAYPVEETIAKIHALPLPEGVKRDLATVLRTGSIPARSS